MYNCLLSEGGVVVEGGGGVGYVDVFHERADEDKGTDLGTYVPPAIRGSGTGSSLAEAEPRYRGTGWMDSLIGVEGRLTVPRLGRGLRWHF